MAPQPFITRNLTRRTNLTLQGNVAIIILVILFVSGIFCAVIFYKICAKQRKSQKAMRRMQEERTPFVNQQDAAPQGAPSAQIQGTQQPYQLENIQPYVYDGPLELQGSGRPVAQEVDGYTAAPTFDDRRPIELPATALVNGADGKTGAVRR